MAGVGWLDGAGRWDEVADGARFSPADQAGSFVLTAHDGRLRVRLEPLPGRAGVDVSVQPAVLPHVVERSARAAGVDPAAATTRVAEAVDRLARRHGLATVDGGSLVARLGAASFPLLALPYDTGRPPLGDIPRWAAPALGHRQARRAADELFGSATTRRVVAALARRLVGDDDRGTSHASGARTNATAPTHPHDGEPPRPDAADLGPVPLDLFRVGVAHCGAVSLDADRLADLLDRPGPPVDPTAGPDVDTVRRARHLLAGLPAARVASWLGDVIAHPHPPAAFVELVDALHDVRAHLPARLPGRRDELVALCRGLTPLDPRGGTGGVESLPPRRTRAQAATATTSTGAATAGALTDGGRSGRATPPGRPAARRRRAPATATARTGVGAAAAAMSAPAPVVAYVDPLRRVPPAPDPGGRALRAPTVSTTASRRAAGAPQQPLPRPPWAAAVDAADLGGGLTLELARTPAELAGWGRLLQNCLADFGPAAVDGRSVLVGVRHHGRLVACAEVAADGDLRQLLGPGNRRAPAAVVAAVVAHLDRAGALHATSSTNAAWRQLAGPRRLPPTLTTNADRTPDLMTPCPAPGRNVIETAGRPPNGAT